VTAGGGPGALPPGGITAPMATGSALDGPAEADAGPGWRSPRVRDGIVLILLLGVVLGLLETFAGNVLQTYALRIGVLVILVVALNLANGFTGVFTLGQIGFMALGAYFSAILTLSVADKASYLPDLPSWLSGISFDWAIGPLPVGWLVATLIAAIAVAGIAALVGAVLMRLSGPFVSVATLGFLVIVGVVLINADAFTRGSRTFSGVRPYTDMWWAWAGAVVTVYVVWRIKRSSYGRAMFAQRGDRWAAMGAGISVLRPRLLAFVVSAFFTAIAGSLYAHFLTSFSPKVFDFGLTFQVVTMLVVGGMGSVSGSVVGTIVVFALTEILRDLAGRTLLYGLDGILLATFLILVIVFRPSGIMGQRELSLDRLFAPFRRP
jgi:branched-chain amino acid transport system permease protein